MSEKVLNSRIIQKHDTEANWNQTESFVPYSGEIIVYDTDTAHSLSRLKVGNGESSVSELPFLQFAPDTIVNLNNIVFTVDENMDLLAHTLSFSVNEDLELVAEADDVVFNIV